jgi:membrane dipeptidase
MLIVDAHLDLAMNAIEWNRDLSRPLQELRAREAGMTDRPDREHGTVSFDEMRRGGVAICVATQIARYVKPSNRLPGWRSPEQAWAMTQAQLAWYGEMTLRGEMTPLTELDSLDRHLARLGRVDGDLDRSAPIGYVLSLEGADSIVTLGHLERARPACHRSCALRTRYLRAGDRRVRRHWRQGAGPAS